MQKLTTLLSLLDTLHFFLKKAPPQKLVVTNDNPTLTTRKEEEEEDELRLGRGKGVFPRRAARAVLALERGDECTAAADDDGKKSTKVFDDVFVPGEKI